MKYLLKKNLVVFVAVFLFTNAHPQGFINTNKTGAKKYLSKFTNEVKLQTVSAETDSTITFLIRDADKQPLDLVLHFDASGKCDSELRTLNCDSCMQKIVNRALSEKQYEWQKMDEHTYWSKNSKRLVLRLLPDKPFSFVIQRSILSRKEYKSQVKGE